MNNISPTRMNILTFDVEEWFHLLDHSSTRTQRVWADYEVRIYENVDRLVTMLQEKRQKATFFCLGWIADVYPDIVRRIHNAGFEIGSHSYAHQLVYQQTRAEYREDLIRSISLLEDITGTKVRAYRAPGFSVRKDSRWAFEVLAECGIEIDCSIFPADRAHGGFREFGIAQPVLVQTGGYELKEFPINLVNVLGRNIIFSGGGYFRICPYWLIRRFMKRSSYVMTYFHPRDFDEDQPVIKDLSALRKLKSYYGLGAAFEKLNRFIDEFEFIDLETANQQTDWSQTRRITF